MANESRVDQQRRDPIEIVPYDSGWPATFDQQRSRVEAALKPWIAGQVEHIGSTSIPGMAAKPIIDMLARVSDYRHTIGLVEAMASIGWVHAPEPGDEQARNGPSASPTSAGAPITCTYSRPTPTNGSRCSPSETTCEPTPTTPPNTDD